MELSFKGAEGPRRISATQRMHAEVARHPCRCNSRQADYEATSRGTNILEISSVAANLHHSVLSREKFITGGTSEKLGDDRNGNFLGEVELIAKFDPILAEHVRRAKSNELSDHYLSSTIQNELIGLFGSATQQKIVSRIIKSKYYRIMVDCTPDISHTEQLSIVVRGVDVNESMGAEIYEHFVEFVGVHDTTGKGLCEQILLFLRKFGIPLADCRGQGYDSGSNMRGNVNGVQARLLELNPKAAYMPCASHRLNLVIADATKSSVVAVSFFGYL